MAQTATVPAAVVGSKAKTGRGAPGSTSSQYFVDMSKRQFPKPAVFFSSQEKTAFSMNRMEEIRLDRTLTHMNMHRRSTLRDIQSGMLSFIRRRQEYGKIKAALEEVVGEKDRCDSQLRALSVAAEERLRTPRGRTTNLADVLDTAKISRLFGFRVERCFKPSTSLKKSAAGRLSQNSASLQDVTQAGPAQSKPARPHTAQPPRATLA